MSQISVVQIVAIAVTIGLNALDGFDVLAISFASPGIAREWGMDRAAHGFVLSMELIGMGVGSIALGGLADKIGRRRTLLGCLLVMATGMLMATQAKNVCTLSVWRVVTGFGIGGLLASINAVAAEFANARRRALSVSLMAIGYPLGAVAGGSIPAVLLKQGDWRSVFWFGAAATAFYSPRVYFLIPESIEWLCQRQPKEAPADVNRTLIRMGHAPVDALPRAQNRGIHRHSQRTLEEIGLAFFCKIGANRPIRYPIEIALCAPANAIAWKEFCKSAE